MSFRLVPKSVTLNHLERHNGVITVILRYFSEFLYDVAVKPLLGLGLPVFQNLLFILYTGNHIKTICAII